MAENIKDYIVEELIHEGRNFSVFRAIKKSDRTPVIIKALKPECFNDRTKDNLKNESRLILKIMSPYIIKFFEMIPFHTSYALVLEEFSTTTLLSYIEKHPLNIEDALKISIQIAKGIGEIHQKNIIHKDIKPENILINPENSIKIIDFSIATSLTREVQQIGQIEQIEGTIAYISPEQTARTTRAIDYRTDLYSFGATLYHLFTRKLPFAAQTAQEMIRMHVSASPSPPSEVNPMIPKAISDIILKCMEKVPENRYKSAFGLIADLEKILSILNEKDEIANFTPGKQDVFDRFHPPEKLFGRSEEISLIKNCFEDLLAGNRSVLCLTGQPGIGRSSLIGELHKFSTQKKGRFASVKYDQFVKNIPFHGISVIFRTLIHEILSHYDPEIEEWRKKILDVLEGNGQVLIKIVPDLKLLIGEQPEVQSLQPQESENRLKYFASKFLKALLQPQRPLVIAFDDFQWVDESTLKLLHYFLLDSTLQSLMVVISYRENEVSAIHPLHTVLSELSEKMPGLLTILPLSNLPAEAIKDLIGEIFSGLPIEEFDALGDIVRKKTHGNPLFVVEFLKYLYENEFINFDTGSLKWSANIRAIVDLKISENVVELLIQKVKHLDRDVLDLMKICAVIGNVFNLSLIQSFTGNDPDKAIGLISIAMQEEFVSQDLQQSGSPGEMTYRFSHDRIHQVFYDLLKQEEKDRLHYQIGHLLLDGSTEEAVEDNIVTIVNHLNHGLKFLLNEEMRNELMTLNMKAGLLIKEAQAFSLAIPYFKNVIDLLEKDCWTSQYAITYSVHENLATCLQLLGEVEQADALFDVCLKNAGSSSEKIDLLLKMIYLKIQVKEYEKVFVYAQRTFDLLGIGINLNPSFFDVVSKFFYVRARLKFYTAESIKNLPNCTEEKYLKLSEIVGVIGYPSFVTGRQLLTALVSLSEVDRALKHGLSKASAAGFIGFATMLGTGKIADYQGSYFYGRLGIEMAEKVPAASDLPLSKLLYAYFIHRWNHPLYEAIPLLMSGYRDAMVKGSIFIGATCVLTVVMIRILVGENLSEIADKNDEAIEEFQKMTSFAEVNILAVFREFIASLQGKSRDVTNCLPQEFHDEIYQKKEIRGDRLYLITYRIWHLVLLFLMNQYKEANDEMENLAPFIEKFPGLLDWTMIYLCYALSLAASLNSPNDNPKDWKTFLTYRNIIEKMSHTSPVNYEIYLKLVDGEKYRIENVPDQATRCFDEAISIGKRDNNLLLTGMGYELFARYYIKNNFYDLVAYFLEKSIHYFKAWGGISKCEAIRRYYHDYLGANITLARVGEISATAGLLATQTTQTKYATRTSTIAQEDTSNFDLNIIFESWRLLSKEINFERLIETMMNLVEVNGGGDKVFLVIMENKEPYIYGERYPDRPTQPLKMSIPLEDRKDHLCVKIVNHVIETQSGIILNSAIEKSPFRDDDYILSSRPKSLVCIPLLKKNEIVAILYLENSQISGAFTPRHLHLLSLLAPQMANSIRNAQLIARDEGKIIVRTKELEEKKRELETVLKNIHEAQDQLIKQEKLASLGLLTAGIAHELKNPLNFIINFSQIAKETLEELADEIQKENKDEKLALIDQISENLTIVDNHGQRANSIIKGMLTQAHQGSGDSEKMEASAFVDKGIESAYDNFRKKEPLFQMKINKIYSEGVPPVIVKSGDLVRVIASIVDNACYAMNIKSKTFGKEFTPLLNVKIEYEEECLFVIIRDNGPGIPRDHLEKIFKPFFTTKPGATGLGLTTAFDIVVKEHKGSLTVISEEGNMTEFMIKIPIIIESKKENDNGN